MDKKFHFITGLPRSGSTLLVSILRQNPRFHASITDPLVMMVRAIIETSQSAPGFKTEVPESRRSNTVKGLFDGYYRHIDQPVIFNTNRAWSLLTPQVDMIFPESRFVVCVRDLTKVLDSFERIFRAYPLAINTVSGNLGSNVYSRCQALMEPEGIVGFAYTGIKQAITGSEKHKLMLIEYDVLCQRPDIVMNSLYNFIGEDPFPHDFDNVEANWDEYDRDIGAPMHRVRKKIQLEPREFLLPPDIVAMFSGAEVWRS